MRQEPLQIGSLTANQIAEIVDAFAKAVVRAKAAEFDGMEIHSAHGYLLNQSVQYRCIRKADL